MTIKTLADLQNEKLDTATTTWKFDNMALEVELARLALDLNAAALGVN